MGFKCTPQFKGLIKNEPKPNQKHRANGKKICQEAFNERYSKSETLDRTRSTQNRYDKFKNGNQMWNAFEEEASQYKVEMVTKKGETCYRSLRADAVIGVAVIFNPPAEMTEGWTDADYEKFYKDSSDFLVSMSDIFEEKNYRGSAEHFDEGTQNDDGNFSRHLHKFYTPKDKEGKYAGNKLDAKLLSEVNQKYPAFMRKRGWDLEDLDTTDWKRMKEEPEYKKSRKEKKKYGKSVNEYIDDLKKNHNDTVNALELIDNLILQKQQLDASRERIQEKEEALEDEYDASRSFFQSMLDIMSLVTNKEYDYNEDLDPDQILKDFKTSIDAIVKDRDTAIEFVQKAKNTYDNALTFINDLKGKEALQKRSQRLSQNEQVILKRTSRLNDLSSAVNEAVKELSRAMDTSGYNPYNE